MVDIANQLILIFLILVSVSGNFELIKLDVESQETCDYQYTCKTPEQKFQNDTCAYYDDERSTYYARPCAEGYICQIVEDKEEPYNYTCNPIQPKTKIGFIGDYCSKDSDCSPPYSTSCKDNSCVSAYVSGANCAVGTGDMGNLWCPAGQYCQTTKIGGIITGKCVPFLDLGGTCTNNFQCSYNAACNITTTGVGVCAELFSIKPGEYIGSCDGNSHWLCTSGACVKSKLKGHYQCVDAVKSLKKTPQECDNPGVNDTNSCLSTEDSITGKSYNSRCECAYNKDASSYCYLFPGDSEYQSYIKYLSKWYSSSAIKNCNTIGRFGFGCQEAHWDSNNREAFMYWSYKVAYYAQSQGAEDCVLSIWIPSYEAAKDSYDSSATFYSLSALAFMAFA